MAARPPVPLAACLLAPLALFALAAPPPARADWPHDPNVNTLARDRRDAGVYLVRWDGTSDAGTAAGSGLLPGAGAGGRARVRGAAHPDALSPARARAAAPDVACVPRR